MGTKILLSATLIAIAGSCNSDKDKKGKCMYREYENVIFRTPDQLPSDPPKYGWVYINECKVDSFYDGVHAYGSPTISRENFMSGSATIRFKGGQEPILVEEFTPYDPKEDQ